ncbi:MAG: sugar ABC transporter permease [Spirochaetales bacterium]|nr:MAG: sugar ABC transporter permease [Spirochaetales bacterium]
MERILRRQETWVFAVLVLLSIIITLINPNFLTAENLMDLLHGQAFIGILAVGLVVVLISGGIDISFTAVATAAQYVMAILIQEKVGNIYIAFLISMAIGIVMGIINAAIIHFFNVPTIIATIGTLNIYYGLLIVFSGGKWIYTMPEWFHHIGESRILTFHNQSGAAFGLSFTAFLWIILMLGTSFLLRFTTLGRKLYAVGGCGFDKTPARRAGINVWQIQMFVYGFMGFIAGIAGVVQVLMVQTVAPNSIVGKELNVLAAVVLGGASLNGGVGTVAGTFLGVILLAVLSNGLTLMRVPSYWYDVAIGLVILLSVIISAIQYNRKRTKSITDKS